MNFFQKTVYFGPERGLQTKFQVTDRKDSLSFTFEGKLLKEEAEAGLDYLVQEMKKALSQYLGKG